MITRARACAVLFALGSLGCTGADSGGREEPPASVSAVVDPAAALTLSLPGGPTVHFESGAVSARTTVSIGVAAGTIPAEYGLQGSAYVLEPSGLAFPAGRVRVTLPFAGGAGSIWLSSGDGYEALPHGAVSGGAISAELPHFSTVFAGLTCTAGAPCTPANPCHVGATRCSGPPACVDQAVNAADGAACCSAHAGTCQAGFCEASTFDGAWRVVAVSCNGGPVPPPFSSWITATNSFWITQAGDVGYSIWTNGPASAVPTGGAPPYGCTIRQRHEVVGTWECLGSGCGAFATAVLGGDACGQSYDDRGGGPGTLPRVPACSGGSLTLDDHVGGQCSDHGYPAPFRMVLVRQ